MGLLAALLEVLLWKMTDSVGMYDCYDTKCRGEGVKFNNTYIKCDNYHNYCDYTNQGQFNACLNYHEIVLLPNSYTIYTDTREIMNIIHKKIFLISFLVYSVQ